MKKNNVCMICFITLLIVGCSKGIKVTVKKTQEQAVQKPASQTSSNTYCQGMSERKEADRS